MGCDIHLYIEYGKEDKNSKPPKINWYDFGGRINPGRNYFMFGILSAGVRTDPTFSFPPKGVPTDCAHTSNRENMLYISDNDSVEGSATMEQAKRWVEGGGCHFVNDNTGKPTWVTHPDWHSHSWLTCDEYEKVLDFYNQEAKKEAENLKGEDVEFFRQPEYEAILAVMKRFKEMGYHTRIVFWFDN